MAMTLADWITTDFDSQGGPTAGNLVAVCTEAGGAFTALTGGHSIAIGPPVALVAGNGSNPAMRCLAYFLERAWKWQEINGPVKRFIDRKTSEVSNKDSIYTPSSRRLINVRTRYIVDIIVEMDDLNDVVIAKANDLTS